MKMKKVLMSLACAAVLACGLALAGCSNGSEPQEKSEEAQVPAMRIGTMQTEDALPFWVAEQDGLYGDAQVDIVTFQSAQELSTAFAAGEIDAAMTDVPEAFRRRRPACLGHARHRGFSGPFRHHDLA